MKTVFTYTVEEGTQRALAEIEKYGCRLGDQHEAVQGAFLQRCYIRLGLTINKANNGYDILSPTHIENMYEEILKTPQRCFIKEPGA